MARTYRATIKGSHNVGILVEPTLHYQTDLTFIGDEPDPHDVAAGIWTRIGSNLLAISPADVTYTSVDVAEQVLPPDIGAAGTYNISSGVGTYTADGHLPYATVPVINLHTATASRSARGWCHPASPRQSAAVNNSLWTSTFLALLQSFADTLALGFDLGTIDITHVNPVVYSRTRHKRSESPYTFKVTAAKANPQIRWLRSRLSSP